MSCNPYSPRWLTSVGAAVGKPRKEGFIAPAEFTPHTRCLVGWVWDENIWPWKAVKAKKVIL